MSQSQRPPDDQPQWPGGDPMPGPSMPSWPDDQPAPKPEQPQHVRTAVLLMYVGGALSLLSVFFGLGNTDELRRQTAEQLRNADQQVTPQQLDTAVNVSVTLTVVVGLIMVGLWVLIGYKNGRGRRWARVLATILGGLNVVFTALALAGSSVTAVSGQGAQSILSLLTAAVALVVVVLLWTQPSRDWFDQFATSRR